MARPGMKLSSTAERLSAGWDARISARTGSVVRYGRCRTVARKSEGGRRRAGPLPWCREGPRHRRRRPRARPVPLPVPRPRRHRRCTARPATPASRRSPSCTRSTCSTAPLSPELAVSLGADFVIVGPEAPLVAGVADAVRARGIDCFGPVARRPRALEGSKAFAKDVMAAAGVPTARSYVCTTPEEIDAALDAFGAPYVVKDDGLAAGKGVVVTDDLRGRARARARLRPAWSSRSTSTAPRCRSSRSPTARRSCRCSPRRTSSARWTATRARTPAAWAPTRRCRGRTRARRRGRADRPAADRRRTAPPRHALRRAALRGAGDHLARRAGHRVQRALRRPRDAGRARPAADPAGRAAAGGRDRAARRVPARCAGATARR